MMKKKKTIRDKIKFIMSEDGARWHRNTKWMQTKCPLCDGHSKKSHFHLHIQEGTPLIYKCHRSSCGISGLLDKNMAKKIGLIGNELLDEIDNEYLKFIGRRQTKSYYKNKNEIDYSEYKTNEAVNEYFLNRTGKELTIEIKDEFRIFTDLNEFYNKNKDYIEYSSIKPFLYYHKFKDYIYFLNDTFTMVLYRQVNGDDKGKFSIISNTNTKTHKPYSFKVLIKDSTLRLHKPKSNTLIIAEGPFDILNARLSATGRLAGTYVASGGNAQIIGIVKEFCKYYYKPVIVIFSDTDVNINFYKYKVLNSVKKRLYKMYVIYNNNSKDIGDNPKDWDLKSYEIYRNEKS